MTSGDDGSDEQAWRPRPAGPGPVDALAGYTDLTEVGRGGDSIVYSARQASLGREVAIKVLLVDDPARAARFAREIEITVDLGRQHPNIVNVLAIGTTDAGRPAIVMDYVEGGTLHDRLKSLGPMGLDEVVRVGAVLADALSFAHERGVLHRDVKPQNVLVLPTSWVLADFGIARLADSEHTSSAETFTYRHAAPQVLDGYPPTAADDLWSLGSTLYTLIDGRPPFASDDPDDDSALGYIRRARTEPHRPLTLPGADDVAAVIDRCLAKDVADRWTSAAELRDAFQALWGPGWQPRATTSRPTPSAGGGAIAPLAPAVSPAVPSTPTAERPEDAVAPAAPLPPAPRRADGPPEPAPVALSAISHVARREDAEPTGTGRPDDTGPDPRDASGRAAPPPPGDLDDDAPRRRSRLPWILGAAALTIGLLLGLLGAVLRGGDDDTQPASSPSSAPVVPELEAPPTDAPRFRGRPSRDLQFVLAAFDYDGANLHLEWTDQSDGEADFYFFRVDPTRDTLLANYGAGTLTADQAITLPLGRACYYMVAMKVTGEFGVSNRRCYTNG